MPVWLALIGDLVPTERRQRAIAMFMGIVFLGQATSMKSTRPDNRGRADHDSGPCQELTSRHQPVMDAGQTGRLGEGYPIFL